MGIAGDVFRVIRQKYTKAFKYSAWRDTTATIVIEDALLRLRSKPSDIKTGKALAEWFILPIDDYFRKRGNLRTYIICFDDHTNMPSAKFVEHHKRYGEYYDQQKKPGFFDKIVEIDGGPLPDSEYLTWSDLFANQRNRKSIFRFLSNYMWYHYTPPYAQQKLIVYGAVVDIHKKYTSIMRIGGVRTSEQTMYPDNYMDNGREDRDIFENTSYVGESDLLPPYIIKHGLKEFGIELDANDKIEVQSYDADHTLILLLFWAKCMRENDPDFLPPIILQRYRTINDLKKNDMIESRVNFDPYFEGNPPPTFKGSAFPIHASFFQRTWPSVFEYIDISQLATIVETQFSNCQYPIETFCALFLMGGNDFIEGFYKMGYDTTVWPVIWQVPEKQVYHDLAQLIIPEDDQCNYWMVRWDSYLSLIRRAITTRYPKYAQYMRDDERINWSSVFWNPPPNVIDTSQEKRKMYSPPHHFNSWRNLNWCLNYYIWGFETDYLNKQIPSGLEKTPTGEAQWGFELIDPTQGPNPMNLHRCNPVRDFERLIKTDPFFARGVGLHLQLPSPQQVIEDVYFSEQEKQQLIHDYVNL